MLSEAQRSRSISAASPEPFNEAAEMLRLRYAPLSMTRFFVFLISRTSLVTTSGLKVRATY
jgi:hypothetical protein